MWRPVTADFCGCAANNTYDAHGRLSGITSNLGGVWITLVSNILHQPGTRQRYAWKFGNGLVRIVTQDEDGRVTHLTSPGAHDLAYGCDVTDGVGADRIGPREWTSVLAEQLLLRRRIPSARIRPSFLQARSSAG